MSLKNLNDKVEKLKLKKGDIVLIKLCAPLMGISFNDLLAGVVRKVDFSQEDKIWTIQVHNGVFVSKSTKQTTVPRFCDIKKITKKDLATRLNFSYTELDRTLENAELAKEQLQF